MTRRDFVLLSLYAIAMAYVEAALVVDLRSVYYPGNPLSVFPLAVLSRRDLIIELVRELATLVMLGAVAWLAARRAMRVFAAFAYLFGLWDIFYYVWLKLMIGWPVHWLQWDILYLIPWPWFGPWIAPALVAALLVAWSARALLSDSPLRFAPWGRFAFGAGIALVLAAFLWTGWPLLAGGETAFRGFVPRGFPWALFGPGYVLLALGLPRKGRSAS
jgi:hypothetical protein